MSDTSNITPALDENLEEDAKKTINRFLTFTSDKLVFGVSTDNVIEIITNYRIRPLPMVPNFIQGIINLRGQIIPVMDMRLRLGKPFREYTPTTCIIILEINSIYIGIVVDSVIQVQNIDVALASPIPIENRQELTNYMISLDDGTVVLLLDCEAVVKAQ
jgi:purine-binding chemotaxis protein CheW